MLAAEGIFDGESVKFSQPVNFKKNQRVIVTLAEEKPQKKELTPEDRKKISQALLEGKFSSPVPTNYDVDALIRYERGRATADDIRKLVHEGTLDPEDLRDFEKEYFLMEKLLKDALFAKKLSDAKKSTEYVEELRARV